MSQVWHITFRHTHILTNTHTHFKDQLVAIKQLFCCPNDAHDRTYTHRKGVQHCAKCYIHPRHLQCHSLFQKMELFLSSLEWKSTDRLLLEYFAVWLILNAIKCIVDGNFVFHQDSAYFLALNAVLLLQCKTFFLWSYSSVNSPELNSSCAALC